MNYPDFYDTLPVITLQDNLARLLGAAEDGIIEFHYLDAVKCAGHSCPTVLGAWLSTAAALKELYGDELPQRGDIEVAFPDGPADGVTGVVATVVGNITGAADQRGFNGLGPAFNRRNQMHFGTDFHGEISFTRRQTGQSVITHSHPGLVPMPATMRELLQRCVRGDAAPQEQEEFGRLWQERVRQLATMENFVTVSVG